MPAEGTTKIHVRFKGGKIETLTTVNPKSSAQQVKTPPGVVEMVDKLLDKHIYSEIAELLSQRGYRPADQRGAAATIPASQPCGSRISSIATGYARDMTDSEIAEC